jgi:hypothetical protein
MKRWLVGLGAVLLVAAGGWYWVSPIVAMHALTVSARAGDRDALAHEVDFPAVRDSLKSQVNAAALGGRAGDSDRPTGLAALGALFVGALANTAMDAVVTPDGIRSLVAAGRVRKPGEAADDDQDTRARWVIDRQGLNRFTARPVKAGDDKPPVLVFGRSGLSWRLTAIELPIDTGPAATSENP